MAWRAPQKAANSCSKSRHSSPPMKCVLATTRATLASISAWIRRYWARRSTIGTFVVIRAAVYLPDAEATKRA